MKTPASNYEKLKELIESSSLEDRELGFLLFDQIREATIFPTLEPGRRYFVQGRSGSPDKPVLCKMWKCILEHTHRSQFNDGAVYFTDQQFNKYLLFPTEILSINAL